MKAKIRIYITLALLLSITTLSAQKVNSENIITISGTRFAYPLLNKWIGEYSKHNSGIQFKILPSNDQDNDALLRVHVIQLNRNVDSNANQHLLQVARFAQLPYSNIHNPVLSLAGRRGFSRKDINNLFFETFGFDDDFEVRKQKFNVNVYSKENQSCLSNSLAGHFGVRPSEIKGSKIFGDENFLLKAVELDTLGVAYNTLSVIYDIESRNLHPGISLLPLDLSRDERRILTGNLDDIISVLENAKIETIPVEQIGIDISQAISNIHVRDFLSWVLGEGQQFVHQYGFLRLDQQVLAQQTARLSEVLVGLNH